MTRLVVALGVLVVAGTVAAPVGAHEPPPPPIPFDSPDRIEVTYEVRLADDPRGVVVHANVDVPSTVDAFAIEPPPGVEVQRMQEFEAENGRYVADAGPRTARLTYRVPHDTPGLRLNTTAPKAWAVVGHRALRRGYTVNPAPGRNPTVIERVRTVGLTQRFPGTAVTLVGDYDVVDSASPDQHRFRVFVPAGLSMAADQEAVLATLAFARQHYDGGHRHDAVRGFVVASTDDSDGVAPHGVPEFVVAADARPGGPDNPWIHQYVHTRQDFSTTADLRWIYEATAEYQAARLSLQQGTTTWEEFRAEATTDRYADVDLTDPDADRFRAAARNKGAAAVAVLDARIRRLTDGERSIDSVLRRMNQRDGAIDTAQFEAIVEDVTREPDTGEVGWMVAPGFDPEPPSNPQLFADQPEGDPDGDGLSNAFERSAGTNPFVADTDGDGVADGTELDRETNATADGSDASGEARTSPAPSATESTDATPESTPTDEDAGPVRVGMFVMWLALLGASVWVVRRR